MWASSTLSAPRRAPPRRCAQSSRACEPPTRMSSSPVVWRSNGLLGEGPDDVRIIAIEQRIEAALRGCEWFDIATSELVAQIARVRLRLRPPSLIIRPFVCLIASAAGWRTLQPTLTAAVALPYWRDRIGISAKISGSNPASSAGRCSAQNHVPVRPFISITS